MLVRGRGVLGRSPRFGDALKSLSLVDGEVVSAEWLRGQSGSSVLVYREATFRERWRVRRSEVAGRLVVEDGGHLAIGGLYALEVWGPDGRATRVGYLRVVAAAAPGRIVVYWHRAGEAVGRGGETTV